MSSAAHRASGPAPGPHLEVLASVAASMARSTDLHAAMDAALEAVLPALGLELGGIYVLDEHSGDLRVARFRGVSSEYAEEVGRFSRGEAFVGATLQGEVPIVVPDLASTPQARDATRRLGIRAVAFVPLYARGRAMGVMPVGSFGLREFSRDDLRLLSAVGGMVGLAIDNERLAVQSQRHLAEVRMLWEIDRALGEDRPLDEVLAVMAREAATFCGGDTAVLLVEGEETQVMAAHGSRALAVLGHPPRLAGQRLSTLLRGPEPHVLRLQLDDTVLHAAFVGVHTAHRQAAVLVVRTQEWDEPELGPLATLAQRASVTVSKARAREAEGRRSGQLALLSAASEIAASTLDVHRLLDAIARYIQRSFGYYSVAIYLVDPEARAAMLYGAAGAAAIVMPKGHRMPFGAGIIGWVAENGEYVLANDVRLEPRFVRARMESTLSELAVPVRLMGEVVAIINVESDRLDAFDEGDVVALDGIAAQVASAIRNARLFEDKVRTVRSLEIVQEITTVLNSDLDLQAVLGRIARRSVEAIKSAQMGAVLLFDEDHLVVRSSYGYPEAEALAPVRLSFHEGLPGSVFVSGQGRFVRNLPDVGTHGAAFRRAAGGVERRSALCVPISLPEQKLGVMLLESSSSPDAFDTADLRFAATLANQAAIAIGNALHLRRILELDHQRQSYLSNVSHELRTPLTVTQGYLEALSSRALPEGCGRQVEVALQNCHRLGRLIDEILEVARLEQGVAQRHLDWAPVSLAEVMRKVVQLVKPEAAVKGLRVIERLPYDFPPMVGDERLLHLMLFNLIENAVKFSVEGGTVEVELAQDGHDVLARVSDTGIGIAREHHERIFDKFFTVDAGSARSHGGTGIGLYLVREVAVIHDGAITVMSQPGRGASFEVKMPFRPAHRA
jgi:signal transduction histidine kinase